MFIMCSGGEYALYIFLSTGGFNSLNFCGLKHRKFYSPSKIVSTYFGEHILRFFLHNMLFFYCLNAPIYYGRAQNILLFFFASSYIKFISTFPWNSWEFVDTDSYAIWERCLSDTSTMGGIANTRITNTHQMLLADKSNRSIVLDF